MRELWYCKTFRIGVLLLALVLMGALIAACGSGSTATTSGSTVTTATPATAGGSTTTGASTASTEASVTTTGAPVKLTVVEGSAAVFPFYEAYVAQSQGFFAKHGLDVKIVEVDGQEQTTTAFASGQADIMMSEFSVLNPSAMKALGSKHPIMFFAFMHSPFSIYVPANSPIKSVTELDGKVVAVNTEQDPGMALIKTVNLENKINAKSLIVNEAPQAMAALDRGDAVAYASSMVGAARIEAAGEPMRSILPEEIVNRQGVFGYWASRDTMDKNPEAMKGFVAALQDARAYIADDPQKLYDWAVAQKRVPAGSEAFDKALSNVVMSIRTHENPVGSINAQQVQAYWDLLLANGTIDSSIGKPTDFYTNEFFAK